MTQPDPSHEWSSRANGQASQPGKACTRAAVLLWILGAIELVGFGCCGGIFTFLAVLPVETIREMVAEQPMPPQISVEQIHAWAPMFAGTILVLGILPALVYAISAFGVYAGKSAACNLALMVLMTQGIVLGVFLLSSVAGAIMMASPMDLTINVIVFGSILALIIAAIRALLTAREFKQDTSGEQADPWNNNQT